MMEEFKLRWSFREKKERKGRIFSKTCLSLGFGGYQTEPFHIGKTKGLLPLQST